MKLQTVLDQVEVNSDGSVGVRFKLRKTVEGETVEFNHRLTATPRNGESAGEAVARMIGRMNDQLTSGGVEASPVDVGRKWPACDSADVPRIDGTIAAAPKGDGVSYIVNFNQALVGRRYANPLNGDVITESYHVGTRAEFLKRSPAAQAFAELVFTPERVAEFEESRRAQAGVMKKLFGR